MEFGCPITILPLDVKQGEWLESTSLGQSETGIFSFNRMLKTTTATKAKNNFGALIRRVYTTGDPVVVEKSGIPLVVVISMVDFESLRQVSPTVPRKALGPRPSPGSQTPHENTAK